MKRAVYDLPLVARAPDKLPEDTADGLLLLHHAEWFCKLRWLVIVAMLAVATAAFMAGPWLRQHGIQLSVSWPLGVAGLLALANMGYLVILRAAVEAAQLRPGLPTVDYGCKSSSIWPWSPWSFISWAVWKPSRR